MTVEQIIEHLNGLKLHCEDIAKLKYSSPEWNKDIEALEEAVKLIKREIKKKPIETEVQSKSGRIKILYKCPVCDGLCAFKNYCDTCGQNLDWSDEND